MLQQKKLNMGWLADSESMKNINKPVPTNRKNVPTRYINSL